MEGTILEPAAWRGMGTRYCAAVILMKGLFDFPVDIVCDLSYYISCCK